MTMKAPAPKKPSPAKPGPSRATVAKVAVIGASVTFVTAKLVDAALVGTGVFAAVGSAAFAGFMLMQGDHKPQVNGMEYLAIFAQPKGGVKSHAPEPGPAPDAQETPAAPEVAAAPPAAVDTAPLGAIDPGRRTARPDRELVAAGVDHAWVRSGARILSVKPGDTIPDIGKVSAIAWLDGHWTLIGEDGRPLLAVSSKAPLAKPMIFGTPGKP
jgi:hypothetical protein